MHGTNVILLFILCKNKSSLDLLTFYCVFLVSLVGIVSEHNLKLITLD